MTGQPSRVGIDAEKRDKGDETSILEALRQLPGNLSSSFQQTLERTRKLPLSILETLQGGYPLHLDLALNDKANADPLGEKIREKAKQPRRTEKHSTFTFEEFVQRVRVKPTEKLDREIEEATGTILTLNEAHLFTDAREAFHFLEQAMLEAEEKILIHVCSWAPDSTGERFAKLLIKLKQRKTRLDIRGRIDKLGSLFIGGKDEFDPRRNPFLLTELFFKTLRAFPKYRQLSIARILGLKGDFNAVHDFSEAEGHELEAIIKEILTPEVLLSINPHLRELIDYGAVRIEDRSLDGMCHVKAYIIDKICLLGGINVGDDHSGGYDEHKGEWGGKIQPWLDYAVALEGPASYIIEHQLFGRADFPAITENLNRQINFIRVLRNKPGSIKGKSLAELAHDKQITFATYHLLQNAKSEIKIHHAYLTDPAVLHMLKQAAARGVKVKILRGLPETTGTETGNIKAFQKLQGVPNIDIKQLSTVTHAKGILVDGKYSLFGSSNLTRASHDHHGEIAVMVSGDCPLQRQLHEEFDKDWQSSEIWEENKDIREVFL